MVCMYDLGVYDWVMYNPPHILTSLHIVQCIAYLSPRICGLMLGFSHSE